MFTRTLIWTWMFSLVVSTVGVSLHAVYCYCAGKSTVSFFEAAEHCAKAEVQVISECCKKHEKKAETCCERPLKERDCTKTTTKVFVLKTDLHLEKNTLKVFEFQYVAEPVSFIDQQFFVAAVVTERVSNKAPPESPPVLSGRDICLRGGVFLC